jgi:hypothetical protein
MWITAWRFNPTNPSVPTAEGKWRDLPAKKFLSSHEKGEEIEQPSSIHTFDSGTLHPDQQPAIDESWEMPTSAIKRASWRR